MAYIANKWNSAQITNIHYWDSVGGAWSGNLIGAATPFALLPNPVNANDFVIFGIDTSVLDSGPFSSLVFDIQVPNVATIVWKYSDAGGGVLPTAWGVQGSVQDNTNQGGLMGGVAFDTVGINSVYWYPNALWIPQNPTVGGVALGVTGYWMCADVTGGAGGAPPTQANRDIYTVTWPTTQLAEPGGDMSALLRIRAREESVAGQQTRLIAGLRKASRGTDFRSFINFADKQNAPGIVVTLGGTAAWQTDPVVPSGRNITDTPAAAWGVTALVQITSAYSNQYRGTYRMFIRAAQLVVPVGAISFRVLQYIGDAVYADLVWQSSSVTMTRTVSYELLDMGQVSVPAVESNEAFETHWTIQTFGNAAAGVDLIDLIILPVDEWASDLYTDLLMPSVRSNVVYQGFCAEIDGITYPRNSPRALSYPYVTGSLQASPRFVGGKGGLIPNEIQYLHSLIAGGVPGSWTSIPSAGSSIESWQVQRYSSMRGAR